MSLLQSRFKTNLKASNEGNWFDLSANSDKTICRFKLARMSDQNKEYTAYSKKIAEPYAALVNLGALPLEKDIELTMDAVLNCIIVDWENFQPDTDGVNVPFSREAVKKYLSDPEWHELYMWVLNTARQSQGFREYRGDAIVKN